WRHWAMITAPSSATSSVTIDGAPVSFAYPHSDGAYTTALVEVAPGPHRVSASRPVNVQIFGDNNYDAYAMPAGMRLREPFRSPGIYARTCNASIDTIITLSNFGGEQIEVTSTSFTTASTSSRTFPSTPFLVPAGGTRQVGIRIVLPRYGRLIDTLRINTSTSGSRPLIIPIDITRDSLAIEVVEPIVDFPVATSSRPTSDTIVHVVNSGTGPVRITALSFTGPFAIVSPTLPITLNAGDTAAVRIRFAPLAVGTSAGRGTVQIGPCGAPVTFDVSGRRLRTAAVDVPTITIPDAECGVDTVDIPIIVRSVGEEPLRFDSVEVRGPGAASFTVTNPAAGTLVAPGSTLVAMLRFAPRLPGRYTIQLRVWNSVSPGGYLLTSLIDARRVSAIPTVSRASIDFGTRGACSGDSTTSITIRNSGTAAMEVKGIATSTSAFASTTTPGFTVLPGDSASVSVVFQATNGGVFNDSLRIAIEPCDTTIVVALAGARDVASIGGATDTVDLGTLATCALPRQSTVSVTNTGSVALDLTSATVEGSAFTIDSISDSTLSVNQSADVRIVVDGPPGTYRGSVVVNAEPCGVERRIPIRFVVGNAALELTGDLNFTAVLPNTPTQMTATLRNTGSIPTAIESVAIAPVVSGLTIISPTTPFTLAAGANTPVVVEYNSPEPESFATVLNVASTTPCVLALSLAVSGQHVNTAALGLTLPDTVGYVDSRVVIPVTAHRVSEGNERVTVRFEVRWNSSMLALESSTTTIASGSLAIVNQSTAGYERIVEFEFSGLLPPDATIAALEMRVLIGTADLTPLRITGASASSIDVPQWTVSNRDGSFRTLGICSIGGGRFIRIAGTFTVKRIAPNPAGDRVTLSIESDARARVGIAIVDALGHRIASVLDGEFAGGLSEASVDVSNVPYGLYFVEVRSGRHVDRVPLIIAR
ncbi:MAG: choice-of-anchor D domain-containing protein, partial [bacterium]|nr:choice-of-anchor D domain-containing protein [Candidatus Kapabacteria bacterium]